MAYTPFTGYSYASGLAALGQGLNRISDGWEREHERQLLENLGKNPTVGNALAAKQPGFAAQLMRNDLEERQLRAGNDAAAKAWGIVNGTGGGPAPVSAGTGDRADVGTLKAALAPMESGGRYDITGPVHPKMGTPLGKYQIMSANLPQWSQEALGRVVSPQEFLSSPELQEKIAGDRMGKILDQYGNLRDAASVWHSGRPLAQAAAAGARDVNMSTVDYVNRTVGRGGGAAAADAQRVATQGGPRQVLSAQNPLIQQGAAPQNGAPPSAEEIPQLVQAGVLPEQITPGYLAEIWQTQPQVRQAVEQWRTAQGGARQPAPQVAALPPAGNEAEVQQAEIDSGMRNADGSFPSMQPQQPRVQVADASGGVPLPYRGAPSSDMPAPGSQEAQFVIPGTQDRVPMERAAQLQRLRQALQVPNLPTEARQALTQQYRDEIQTLRTEAAADRRQREQIASEERRQRMQIEAEERKAEADRARGPASVQEFVHARREGWTKANTPAEYEREKAEITKKNEDKALPAELGARVALAQSFLDEADSLRAKVAEGGVTGPIDAGRAYAGSGAPGEIMRKIKSGSEAIVRNLTGAGMNESEARARVKQYEPEWNDSADTVLSKFDMLRDQLLRIEAEAYRGRGIPEARKGKNPYFEGAARQAPPSSGPAQTPAQRPSAGGAIPEGATATNPQTGQRIRFIRGQWVPEA